MQVFVKHNFTIRKQKNGGYLMYFYENKTLKISEKKKSNNENGTEDYE